ncbi:MAG: DUF2382 domain-containing protein [Leptolyngbyaceae cyanobacterium bins.59]|nr:DUF2382 domain-containing protein [Leptolyngbyaceae cyanobacterium bins.59]
MVLYKLHEFDADYRQSFDGDDVKGLDVYTETTDEKVGTVSDALIDENGRFRYLIVDTGFWIFGKKVLLPIAYSRIDYNSNRVYARASKDQIQNLPNVSDLEKIDYEHEEQVRGVYRSADTASTGIGAVAGNVMPTGSDRVNTSSIENDRYAATTNINADRTDRYDYDREPNLYSMNDRDHQKLRLYEERLIANKQRVKTGEVTVGKHVETETTRVSVPLEKERVVIERTPGSDQAISADADAFTEGREVARMEVYEEVPDIHKEAFVREEVNVRKVVDQDTVSAEEQIRREELDLDKGGNPIIKDRT